MHLCLMNAKWPLFIVHGIRMILGAPYMVKGSGPAHWRFLSLMTSLSYRITVELWGNKVTMAL